MVNCRLSDAKMEDPVRWDLWLPKVTGFMQQSNEKPRRRW
jgi:hypothetical protein